MIRLPFYELIGAYKGRKFIFIGAAHTTKLYEEQIRELIVKENLVTIGVNNITHLFIPDFHLWVNNGRVGEFYHCYNPKSHLMIGSHIKEHHYKLFENIVDSYYYIKYTDDFNNIYESIDYKNDTIHGFYRVGGNLALMICHLMGAEHIYVTGVDGYSKPIQGNQHCYGKGFTDSDDMIWEKKKDKMIYYAMRNIANFGVKFSIITPTLYEQFFDKEKLKHVN